MSHPKVTIYSLSTCSHCKATKKFLGECTIKYEFIEVDKLKGDERKAIIEDIKKFNPRCSFPTIIIGETVIVGYKEKEIKGGSGNGMIPQELYDRMKKVQEAKRLLFQ